MKSKKIYKIIAEITGEEIKYLQKAKEVQLIRPSEVIEIVQKAIQETKKDNKINEMSEDISNEKLLTEYYNAKKNFELEEKLLKEIEQALIKKNILKKLD